MKWEDVGKGFSHLAEGNGGEVMERDWNRCGLTDEL